MRKNLVEEFDRCWRDHPTKTAVIDQSGSITFEQLARKSMALAGIITKDLHGRRNTPVAVLLPKCANVVVSDLAISYSCNIFMNLDIHLPEARLQNILALIKPAMILTNNQMAETANRFGISVVNLDTAELDAIQIDKIHEGLMESLCNQIDTDPYCIINTSGSTGTPKGVVLNHRSFFDFYDWSLETFHFDGSEMIGSLSPVVFDIYD